MNDKELAKRLRVLREDLDAEGERIRRYSMDPFLKEPDVAGQPDPGAKLRDQLETAWAHWYAIKGKLRELQAAATLPAVNALEAESEKLEREIDLVQRELISEE